MDYVAIDPTKLPPEEHAAVRTVSSNLTHLQMAACEFRDTAELYFLAHNQKLSGRYDSRRMIAWINIAGRNGAIVAHGIHKAMEAIEKVKAPTLKGLIDIDEQQLATSLFAAEFPNIAAIRHSAAHPGEFSGNEKDLKKHRLREPMMGRLGYLGAGAFVTGGMTAGKDRLIYTASFKGEPADYELSTRKADALDRVAQHYCRAFYPLDRNRAFWGR
jgi:hypothetical protein